MKKYDYISQYYETVVLPRYQKKFQEGNKITVAFFVSQKQLWTSQSIYNELLLHENFTPIIIAFPNQENKVKSKIETCQDNYNFFKSKNMNVKYGYNIQNDEFLSYEEIQADIVFFDQPYPRLPEEIRWPQIYKKSLVCYVPYGYKIASFYEAHFNMDLQNSCWTIFAESSWHKEQFTKYGSLNGKNVVTSGYPKLDTYKVPSKENLWNKIKPDNKKRIIWAPHWSIDEINYSTFHKNYKYFLEFAKTNKSISWIFKPHQRLKHHLVEKNFMTEKEVNEYYEEWNKLNNACYYNDSDYFDIFKDSDALITDCGSFLAEYLPTKKPIIHLINEKSCGYNDLGQELTNSYYKSYNNEDITNLIFDVIINENDYKKEDRLSKLPLVQPNINGAGKFIIDFFIEKLSKHNKQSNDKEVYLEIGSGAKKGKNNWITVDLSSEADISYDLNYGLPFEDSSISIIYSEHFLEHLTYKEAKVFLKEALRVLKKDGVFSICVPDARLWIEYYMNVNSKTEIKNPKEVFPGSGYLPAFNFTTAIDMINYIAYFDQDNLLHILTKNGFDDVQKREYDPSLDTKSRSASSIYAKAYKR